MKIGILTDSTCDLSDEIVEKYGIEIIPLSVNFTNEVYRDRFDISSEEFFVKQGKAEKLPNTSQPSIGLFLDKFEEMSEKYDTIIALHLSGKLSGTYEAACLAARQLEDYDIKTFDSHSASLGLGLLTLLAARLADKEMKAEKILDILKEARENIFIYFSVNDLHYLEKGGRIGKAQAFLGSILNFNPILTLQGNSGEVLPFEKTRGSKRTRQKLLSQFEELINGEEHVWAGILHGDLQSDQKKFIGEINDMIEQRDIIKVKEKSIISPVLGCHVGPSVYGFGVVKGDFLKNAD